MNTAPNRRQRGLTLIEASVVLSIVAVSAGLAAPGFEQLRERRHLEGVAAQLENDIALSRSLAVAQNRTLRLDFTGPRCYVLHDGPAASCDCGADGLAQCGDHVQAYRVVRLAPEVPVTIQSNSKSIAIDAIRGIITPTATLQVKGASGAAIHNVVNLRGRVRQCSPAPALSGYAAC